MATMPWMVMKNARARLFRPITLLHRTLTKDSETERSVDSPVKFTTSKAASWNARTSRGDFRGDGSPWFEPYVIYSSIAVFLIYFCALREENDIDLELSKNLYDRLPGLEKKQLEVVLRYNESKGLDTADIKSRLEEINNETAKINEDSN